MVGAIADWFAVTALFRRPLGLPIPHTALIVERKDQFAATLGQFVRRTPSTPTCWPTGSAPRAWCPGLPAGCPIRTTPPAWPGTRPTRWSRWPRRCATRTSSRC